MQFRTYKFIQFASVILGMTVYVSSRMCLANPYPDPSKIPVDKILSDFSLSAAPQEPISLAAAKADGLPVLRVHVDWRSAGDDFALGAIELESSGTDALANAVRFDDKHGSYKARLVDPDSGTAVAFSTIGTGSRYRHLARTLTFRFPVPAKPMRFELEAENPTSGVMERVISQIIDPATATKPTAIEGLEVRSLLAAQQSPRLILNIYAEGYAESRRSQFWQDAAKVVNALSQNKFPMLAHMELRGVFAPSNTKLGPPQNLGLPVKEKDSFLGLFFPYWSNFARYSMIVYPTAEVKFRRAAGQVPYDYIFALTDSSTYWGVGNFKELTAIPAQSDRFTYLLLHEIGHFFGLNEEYNGGGTELEFASGTQEPWSQNITFQNTRAKLKWVQFVDASTAIPTPSGSWRGSNYGAYQGGYGSARNQVWKPGLACIMDTGSTYCPICRHAIEERVRIDLGMQTLPQQNNNCACRADAQSGTCGLYRGTALIASTPLFGSKSCDQSFCQTYFALSLAQQCK